MPMPDNLTGLEGAFHDAPSLITAHAWHYAAITAYRHEEIDIRELCNIGDAVRTWARVHHIQVPERA